MPEPRVYREVPVALPLELVRAMFRRAEMWDLDRGGRFDKRDAAIIVWSNSAPPTEEGAPIGGAHFRWHDPDDASATVWKVEWNAEEGGSESLVWGSLNLVPGRPIDRS